MKRQLIIVFISLLLLVLNDNSGFAQKVQFKYDSKLVKGDRYLITIKALIPDSWHIYSQTSPDDGPNPTRVVFNSNPFIKLEGAVNEKGKMIKHFEEVFDLTVEYFEDSVEYTQLVKLNSKQKLKTNITGSVEYMLCTDGRCLSPTKEKFSIELK